MNISIPTGYYSTQSITSNTDIRDVSQLLDLWVHKWTPLLNRISWGPESGGLKIEWVHEHLGWGYVLNSNAITSATTAFAILSGGAEGSGHDEQIKQIHPGTLLYALGSGGDQSGGHSWLLVSTIDASTTCTFAFLTSTTASMAASTKLYIVGSFANEGSEPDRDVSRKRTLLSNKMTILRKDIQITGSQAATDMHAVSNELQHQIRLRLLEMQFERERSVLYGWGQARSATAAGLMQGAAELLLRQSAKDFVDDATTSLTETVFNDKYAECVDCGFSPNVIVGPVKQIRKFTAWDRDRVRTKVDDRLGGKYISQYLTDTGEVVDLIALKKAPESFVFGLSTDLMKLRAKKGRKLLLQKLGLKGDFQQWQMISEYSLEMRSVSNGAHLAWTVLT